MKAVVFALFLVISLTPAAGVAGQNEIQDITLALQPGSPGTNYVMQVTTPAP